MFRVSNVQNAGLLRTMGTFKITCGVAPDVFVGVLSLFCFSSCLPCFWVYFGLAFLQVLCWIRVGSILPGQDALFDLFSSVLFVVACWVSVCVSLFSFCSVFFYSWVILATFSVGIAVIPWEPCLGFVGL